MTDMIVKLTCYGNDYEKVFTVIFLNNCRKNYKDATEVQKRKSS